MLFYTKGLIWGLNVIIINLLAFITEVDLWNDCNIANLIVGNNVDYDSGPYTVIIPAGNENVMFDVSIIDDNQLEMNETFELSIESTSLSSRVFPGTSTSLPSTTTVYIINDDIQSKH